MNNPGKRLINSLQFPGIILQITMKNGQIFIAIKTSNDESEMK